MSIKANVNGTICSFSWNEFEKFITGKWLGVSVEIIDVIGN